MNDSHSHARESGRPGPEQADEAPFWADLTVTLHRLGGSDLACCCSLALLARELCGRRCRVEVTGDRSGAAEDPTGPDRAAADAGPGWHRIPVRAPDASGEPEAWLAVERNGGERTPPGLDRLSPLVTLAALMLARHRLAREALQARRDAREVRGVLGHALRGHLHTALLRTDSLLLGLPEGGDSDITLVREQLEDLKDTVMGMAKEIREVVDAPDAPGGPPPRSSAGPREDLRIPELLREAAGREGGGEAAPRVDVEGRIPAVRGDPRQLGFALAELIELARRSRSTPTLSVRPAGSPAGARIDLSVELEPFIGTGGDPDELEAPTGAPSAGAGPDGPDGEEREEERPSLRDVVDRLGGWLRVEAEDRTRATVVVILPAGEGD